MGTVRLQGLRHVEKLPFTDSAETALQRIRWFLWVLLIPIFLYNSRTQTRLRVFLRKRGKASTGLCFESISLSTKTRLRSPQGSPTSYSCSWVAGENNMTQKSLSRGARYHGPNNTSNSIRAGAYRGHHNPIPDGKAHFCDCGSG